jgi:hypothetical protein
MLWTLLVVFMAIQPTPQQRAQSALERISFLVGRWIGEGTGTPGNAVGEFSFEWDLQRRVLVRKSFAEYPATKETPASRHDDLMVVFEDSSGLKANYFDSEGHVIRYTVTASKDGKTVQFLSDEAPSTPTYRLTYTKSAGNDSMKLKFEVATPDQPTTFKPYIDASLRRVR